MMGSLVAKQNCKTELEGFTSRALAVTACDWVREVLV